MNIHTQCLNLIILGITLYPISIIQLASSIGQKGKGEDNRKFMKNLLWCYCLLIAVSVAINVESFNIKLPSNDKWYVVAVIAAPCVILAEIALAYIIKFIKGDKVYEINIVSTWENTEFRERLTIVLIGIAEEFIYRLIWFYILINIFHLNVVTTIVISSIFYAMNHGIFGRSVLIQKVLSGCVFGVVYYLSGYSILIPIIMHGLQNTIIVIKGGKQ